MPKLTYQVTGDDIIKQAIKNNNYKINHELLTHCEKFTSLANFARYIKKQGKAPDYLGVQGIPFTMEEYDEQGKKLNYYNKKLDISIVVEHHNRYNDFHNLKEVYAYHAGCWRNDINFLE